METSLSLLRKELDTTLDLCEVINTPRSLTVYLLLSGEKAEWDQYLELECNPSHYLDPEHFARDKLVTGLMQKSQVLPLEIDLQAKALASFRDAEQQCRETNERLRATDYVDLPHWWRKAEKVAARILGELTPEVLNWISEHGAQGPGAVVGVPGQGTTLSDKYTKTPSVTAELLPFARHIMGDAWFDYACNNGVTPRVVRGNWFFTVPKKATELRGCAKGPLVNVFCQLAVKRFVEGRLRLFGVDLRTQDWNRWLASMAYEWDLVTLDLRSASDLMALEVPLRLLPDRWGHLFALLREKETRLPDGHWVRLEKFCAMGNGYTFVLQTLIFRSVIEAICGRGDLPLTAVYGDDIIVPRRHAQEVITALEFLGFSVNLKKSCLARNFFESCGADYLFGYPVRPFFFRSLPEDPIPFEVAAANRLRLWSRDRTRGLGCHNQFRGSWTRLAKACPTPWRGLRTPLCLGDAGLISSDVEVRSRSKPHIPEKVPGYGGPDHGWTELREIQQVLIRPKKADKRTFGVVLSALAAGRDPLEIVQTIDWRASYAKDIWREPVFEASCSPTLGFEPVRGFLGRPRTKWTPMRLGSENLAWV